MKFTNNSVNFGAMNLKLGIKISVDDNDDDKTKKIMTQPIFKLGPPELA